MNYTEGIEYMLNLRNERGQFSPYEGILINYPGYKRAGDYRLTVQGGTAPRHATISNQLYNLINDNVYTFQQLRDFLIDIYYNGTNTTYDNANLQYLQHLIYWITLQEEINYPRRRGFAGINLAFCRFVEAIYSTQPNINFTIQTVQARCDNHGGPRPILYNIINAPDFYHY